MRHFRIAYKQWLSGIDVGVNRALQGAVRETFEDVRDSSRVLTGHFRKHWTVSTGSPELTVDDPPKKGTVLGPPAVPPAVKNLKIGDRIYLSNNVHYGKYLNDGTIHISPDAYIEKAANAWTTRMKKHLQREVKS